MIRKSRVGSKGELGLIQRIEELMYRWREAEAYLHYLCT